MKRERYVYFFGSGRAEGRGTWKDLLGSKGAGLAEMTRLGIPVPPGFTITTEACRQFYAADRQHPPRLWEKVLANLRRVERVMGVRFGDSVDPLLVSVRSGGKVSMPGMMDTVLNVGLNDDTVRGLAKRTNNPRFAYDSYRRFLAMFGSIVMRIPRERFENLLAAKKQRLGVRDDSALDAGVFIDLVKQYKVLIASETGREFPLDPLVQLRMSIDAVFNSWNSDRAAEYRAIHRIPHDAGTAVSVVAMVFGNMGNHSGTGVAFTRDPKTGERRFFGECLINAQGEDVVAGIRTPMPIKELARRLPSAHRELCRVYRRLERHYRDMLDLEFTIQEGTLYMLQTRTGKRTAAAAVKIAVDLVREGLITKGEAILRIEPEQLDQLLHPMVDPQAKVQVIAKGLPASPGAATGSVVFTAAEAKTRAEAGEKVILVRPETSPEDIGGMHAAQGVLTSRGGETSHAALVARGMGKCCIVGCGEIRIDEARRLFIAGNQTVRAGDVVTLNGSTGEVILGPVRLIKPSTRRLSKEFRILMRWVDETRRLRVRANADSPHDAAVARAFGAEGIGLCRTEHMFFKPERIRAVREMILAESSEARRKALAKILPMQKADFIGIFKAMRGLPVTIRLLDPPLHEFLPNTDEALADLAADLGVPFEVLRAKNKSLQEFNPMLGHRGCRLGITYPEIYEIQTQAIFAAASELARQRYRVHPEVMIPLVSDVKELDRLAALCHRTAKAVMDRFRVRVPYTVGTMIELPRAALMADEIARTADFFSFGTNDLTQTVFGLSRDDGGKFMPYYLEHGLFSQDPFAVLDEQGVGQLMRMGVEKGRAARPTLKVGICGEHGGEPTSVEFCHRLGLDYVSCSPFRVPIARLSAAQAVLRHPHRPRRRRQSHTLRASR